MIKGYDQLGRDPTELVQRVKQQGANVPALSRGNFLMKFEVLTVDHQLYF